MLNPQAEMYAALEAREVEQVRSVLAWARPHYIAADYDQFLRVAVQTLAEEVVHVFLGEGARDRTGELVEWAARLEHRGIVQALVASGAPVDLALPDAAGRDLPLLADLLAGSVGPHSLQTALYAAVTRGSAAAVAALLAAGAKYDSLAWEDAWQRGDSTILELLSAAEPKRNP